MARVIITDSIPWKIDCLIDNMQRRLSKVKERRRQYRIRWKLSLESIRYLEKVVLLDGCTYHIGRRTFSSMERALEYCKRIPVERCRKRWGAGIQITIKNPKAGKFVTPSDVPEHILVKDSKDVLCRYAGERRLIIAEDLSEVYTEYFDLETIEHDGSECISVHIYDYGLLYGNYPIYDGTELCLSLFTSRYGSQGNPTFVPEPPEPGSFRLNCEPNKEYRFGYDTYVAYNCYSIEFMSDRRVDDDGNYAFPFGAIPVSTFVPIGSAGVYYPGINELHNLNRCAKYFKVAGEQYSLFRFALLACKQMEVPEGTAHYTLTAVSKDADGLLPETALPLRLRDSYDVLTPHAKERIFYLSPHFDEVYWEQFTLQDAAGGVHHFCYDHGLLKSEECANLAGEHQITYWQKARWGNPRMNATVIIEQTPDPDALYDGNGNLAYCCRCRAGDEEVYIPVSTLK